MATRNDGDNYGYIFQWKIINLDYSWLKKGEGLKSPTFIASGLKNTKWSLLFYPRGNAEEGYVALYLSREKDCSGPKTIEVNCELAYLGKNGALLSEKTIPVRDFERGNEWGFEKFEIRKKIFDTEREAFFPENTLTVSCIIWITDEKPAKSNHSFATTAIKVERRSFVWKTNKICSLNPDVRNKFKEDLIVFDVFLDERSAYSKQLCLNIISFDKSLKYFSFKASERGKSNVAVKECFAGDLKKGINRIVYIATQDIFFNLHRNAVSLDCEYAFSTGIAFNVDEDFDLGYISPEVTTEVVGIKNETCIEPEKCRNTSDLAIDLKSMYCDAVLCDMELRTSTCNFPAHKTILCARSFVFRRMFSYDMKEKIIGHVDIADLEDDTVHRMLIYMYTDSLGDLQFETAFKLYAAADKYEIMSLMSKCSSFFKEHLSPTKVCDVLILADLHQDDDLKCFVQNYILEHDQEVFGSQEWKDFMDTYPKLAAYIMYQKVFPV